jgi:aminopeptidase-like protein
MNLLAYADGSNSLLEIADKINVPMWDLIPIVKTLKHNKLLIRDH